MSKPMRMMMMDNNKFDLDNMNTSVELLNDRNIEHTNQTVQTNSIESVPSPSHRHNTIPVFARKSYPIEHQVSQFNKSPTQLRIKKSLAGHLWQVHPNKLYPCEVSWCCNQFSVESRLIDHYAVVHNGINFPCDDQCKLLRDNKQFLKDHLRTFHHIKWDKPSNIYKNQQQIIKYPQPEYQSLMDATIDDVIQEENIATLDIAKPCGICGMELFSDKQLKRHLRHFKHQQPELKRLEHLDQLCVICGMKLQSKRQIRMHYKVSGHNFKKAPEKPRLEDQTLQQHQIIELNKSTDHLCLFRPKNMHSKSRCVVKFKTFLDLFDHYRTVHYGVNFPCVQCRVLEGKFHLLVPHFRTYHKIYHTINLNHLSSIQPNTKLKSTFEHPNFNTLKPPITLSVLQTSKQNSCDKNFKTNNDTILHYGNPFGKGFNFPCVQFIMISSRKDLLARPHFEPIFHSLSQASSSQQSLQECYYEDVCEDEEKLIETSVKRTIDEVLEEGGEMMDNVQNEKQSWEHVRNSQANENDSDLSVVNCQMKGDMNEVDQQNKKLSVNGLSGMANSVSIVTTSSSQPQQSPPLESIEINEECDKVDITLQCNEGSSLHSSSQHLVRECRIVDAVEKVDDEMESIESSMKRWTWNEVEKCWELMKNGQIDCDEENDEVGEENDNDENEDGVDQLNGLEQRSNLDGTEAHHMAQSIPSCMFQASSQHLVREWSWNEGEKCWELKMNGQIDGDEGNDEVGEVKG